MCFWKPHEQVFQQKLGTKINFSEAGDPLKINFLSLTSLPWLRPCLSHKNIYRGIYIYIYITKGDDTFKFWQE